LNFTADHELDNDIFSPNAENLQNNVFATKATMKIKGSNVAAIQTHLIWDIAITEPVPRYVKAAVKPKNKLESQLNNLLGGMNLGP
jgi:hypothetical protein